MRSYLDEVMAANDSLKYKATLHWIIYVWPIFLIALGTVLYVVTSNPIVLIFFIWGFFGFIWALLVDKSTDLAVTQKKVIGKWGVISRQTIEQRLDKVDAVKIDQSILGRLLNYGSIQVSGSGTTQTPIKNVVNPLRFRKEIELAESGIAPGQK